jgi:dihydrofolate reductase
MNEMRKIKLQMQVSIDGFNSTGPDDEMKWITWDLDEVQKQYTIDLLDTSDTIIMGRKLAENFFPAWEARVKQTDHPMNDYAVRIVNARKVVFTNSLDKSIWERTELAKGNLIEEINKLKKQSGKDIIVYGGSSFVASLINEKLIDEFHLFINPIALGKGVATFGKLRNWQLLKLINSTICKNGIVINSYLTK